MSYCQCRIQHLDYQIALDNVYIDCCTRFQGISKMSYSSESSSKSNFEMEASYHIPLKKSNNAYKSI